MALEITISLDDGSERTFTLGNKRILDYHPVTEIKASGEELNLIHSWGYPNHNKLTQVFIGDTARQICANW